ncbi:MAG: HAD-IA family hydrolase [Chloroflexi bacterium]|nr:HAD-IA family hydrolase [Chloroflexota bacterium]
MRKEYSTYLFDVGGTLIKFDETRRALAYAERAAAVGVTVSWQDTARLLEALDHELPERTRHLPLSLLAVQEQRAFWIDFWAEGFRRIGVRESDALRFANELLDPVHGRNFQAVFEDAIPALEALRARGKRLAIISNFSPNCETLLRELGLAHYFDFYIVSGILRVEKPDARIFQAAIDASGKPVAELVYIGDSVFHDVHGAQSVGMDAILIDRADKHCQEQLDRVRDLREL